MSPEHQECSARSTYDMLEPCRHRYKCRHLPVVVVPVPLVRALVAIRGAGRRWDSALRQAAALLLPPELRLGAGVGAGLGRFRGGIGGTPVRIGLPRTVGGAGWRLWNVRDARHTASVQRQNIRTLHNNIQL